MGCVASKLEQEEEVVAILRERKNYLKLAVEKRYALAEAHCRFNKSLFAVSAAIKLFVARHSSPTAPFFITFPDPESELQPPAIETAETNPKFLQQPPTEPTQKALKQIDSGQTESQPCPESSVSKELKMERDEHHHHLHQHKHQHHQEQHMNGYYYMQMPPPMPIQSANGDFGWDFFNPFQEMRPEAISQSYRNYTEEDLEAVRLQEGIPELEEEGDSEDQNSEDDEVVVAQENGMNGNNIEVASSGEKKGLNVIHTPEVGRELLDALRDIEDYFIRAYNYGKEVSKMLDADRIHLHSNLEEIKENSTKLLSIAWHRSTSSSSRASSCKSLVASSSKSSSGWTEAKNDLFDGYEGMESGSHSLTLERLYAWEKKLYEEVKIGDNTRKIYEKKCSQLKHQDTGGDDVFSSDKRRAAVKDLYARILVAIRSAESISRRIDKLRDQELQPQIYELLQGLMRSWKVLYEAHETQNRILSEVNSFTRLKSEKFCSDSHRLATLQLQIELHCWRTCFVDYVAATRGYIEALYNWLTKFIATEAEGRTNNRRPSSIPVHHANGPPLLGTFNDWLESMKLLPDQSVSNSMKGFAKDVRALWLRQGEELQQKRRVDSLTKEYNKRRHLFEKQEENQVLAIKLTEDRYEPDQDENLADKNNQLDTMRKRLDLEIEKHLNCVQETQHITLNGLQTGFCSVFESLIHFSRASLKMYSNLVGMEESGEPRILDSSLSEQDGLR